MEAKPLAPPPPAAAPPASQARLFILLGLLAIVVGAYGYDYFVAMPACDAADKKIQEFVDTRNKMGVKDGALVTSTDIQKELGMQPTYVETNDDRGYSVDYYCWWGKMPMLSKRRHFISVVYVGPKEPRRVSSHHREEPPSEALPLDPAAISKAASDGSGATNAESPAEAASTAESPPASDAPPAADAPAKDSEAKPASDVPQETKKAEETSAP